MMRKANITLFSLAVGVMPLMAGCTTHSNPTFEIRSVGTHQPVPDKDSQLDSGRQLLDRKQNAEAITAFRIALRSGEDIAEANNGMAIAYDRLGRADLAQRYFELAVANKPEDARYRKNLAHFFMSRGQPKLAKGLIEEPLVAGDELPVEVKIAAPVLQELANDPIEEFLSEMRADFAEKMSSGQVVAKATVVQMESRPIQYPEIAVVRGVNPAPLAAKQIGTPFLPEPDLPLPVRRPTYLADNLRLERRFFDTAGPRMERISLGQVMLVTLPPALDHVPRFGIDALEEKLSKWADDEARLVALADDQGLKGKFVIQGAIERAAVAEAIAAAEHLVEAAEAMTTKFAYAFFDYGPADPDALVS
jgi:hypothetical protein